MDKLEDILIQIQDYLVPKLDTYEQAIYHYVFRHTYLINKKQMLYSTRSAEIGLGTGDNKKPPSMKTRSKKLRSLEEKGAVTIIERSNKGILVELRLPEEMTGLIEKEASKNIDMETLDFYKDRRLLPTILERENYRCFYTGKKLTEENCYLDHVVPQSKRGTNYYTNIVATCYDANSIKNDLDVDDFRRVLLREDLVSLEEFKNLKDKIVKLQEGELRPSKEAILQAVS